MKEKWKVIDFANNYEVSNTGFIRNKTTKYVLKGRPTPKGYLQVSIKYNELNKFINQYIHRLVALFWLNNISNDNLEVNHKDGNKANNNVNNLEWVTKKENSLHKTRVLNKKITSNRQVGMYDMNNVLIQEFNSVNEAGEFFGKSRINIDSALKHKNNQQTAYGYIWKYLN